MAASSFCARSVLQRLGAASRCRRAATTLFDFGPDFAKRKTSSLFSARVVTLSVGTQRRWLSGAVSSAADESRFEAVTLTDKGAARLLEISENIPDAANSRLRLSVEGGGCSGFQYKFEIEKGKLDAEYDLVFPHPNGAELVVDDVSIEFVQGAKVDFVEDLMRRAFEVVDNPNADSSCGCGVSFAAKV